MIVEPLNDAECLSKITARASEMVRSPDVQAIAGRFAATDELAEWIGSLPQRNDEGDPDDGPRVPCDVSQRLRLPAEDPNCVERSALYIAAAEIIDPGPLRRLATIDTPIGRHTFPVENDVPVRLDPRVPRNALDAGVWRIVDPSDPRGIPPRDVLEWIVSVAEEPASDRRGGTRRLRNAEGGFAALLSGRPVARTTYVDIAYVLGLAREAAKAFGDKGLALVRLRAIAVEHTLARQPRNRARLAVGRGRVRADRKKVSEIGRFGLQTGARLGADLLKAKLGILGFAPEIVLAVEQILGREGRTLGVLAEPPPATGTLASLTTSALLQKRLAS